MKLFRAFGAKLDFLTTRLYAKLKDVYTRESLAADRHSDTPRKPIEYHRCVRSDIYLFIYLFIKTYLYRVVHNQTILILFYSVALFLAKSKSSDN